MPGPMDLSSDPSLLDRRGNYIDYVQHNVDGSSNNASLSRTTHILTPSSSTRDTNEPASSPKATLFNF